jgi:hypothetical protein
MKKEITAEKLIDILKGLINDQIIFSSFTEISCLSEIFLKLNIKDYSYKYMYFNQEKLEFEENFLLFKNKFNELLIKEKRKEEYFKKLNKIQNKIQKLKEEYSDIIK